jgi:eukaryotic-like serine/threonine-protein kinase
MPAPAAEVRSGDRLGEFTVIRTLGEGGSAVVYAARWRGHEVALKVLRPELASILGEREVEHFLVEARRLGQVDHPRVVKLLGSGRLPDGRPYIVMPLLRGETLRARLDRGPLPAEQAMAVFADVADAMATLHEAGLIHRDLKPENVFLPRGRTRALLLDLGIAKDEAEPPSTTTREGRVRGTPAYMAPERFFGAPATRASDVYPRRRARATSTSSRSCSTCSSAGACRGRAWPAPRRA